MLRHDRVTRRLLHHLCSGTFVLIYVGCIESVEQYGLRDVTSFYVEADMQPLRMTAAILLVRHASHDEIGRVLSGRSEIALNTMGRSEAEALAARLAAEPIASIYSSPRRRALETAGAIAAAHGARVTIAPALDEVDFGAWTGRPFSDLDSDPAWHGWNSSRGSAATPGGETMAQAIDRAEAFLRSIDGQALCVTHCDIIRGIVARRSGIGLDRLLELDCAPASVTPLPAELRAAA